MRRSGHTGTCADRTTEWWRRPSEAEPLGHDPDHGKEPELAVNAVVAIPSGEPLRKRRPASSSGAAPNPRPDWRSGPTLVLEVDREATQRRHRRFQIRGETAPAASRPCITSRPP